MDHYLSYRRGITDIVSDYSMTYPDDVDAAVKALLEDKLADGWELIHVADITNAGGTLWLFRATGRNS